MQLRSTLPAILASALVSALVAIVEAGLTGQQVNALDDEPDLLGRQGALQLIPPLSGDAASVAAQRAGEPSLIHDL